jgi:hypothetical protein
VILHVSHVSGITMAMPSNVCEVSDPDLELWASEDQDSGEESDGDTAMDQR